MIKRLVAGILALLVVLVVLLAKYVAPMILWLVIGLAVWAEEDYRGGFLPVLAILSVGALLIAIYSVWERRRLRRKK